MGERNFLPSNKRNPCPICARSHDADCRISGDLVLCRVGTRHRPPTELAGAQVTGRDGRQWICRGPARDAGWIQFALAGTSNSEKNIKRNSTRNKHPQRVLPNCSVLMTDIVTSPVELARLLDPLPDAPPPHLANGYLLNYSPTQRVTVKISDRGKAFPVQYLANNGEPTAWANGAGPDPWPLWQQVEALQHGRGHWVTEAEGEKCTDWLRAGGLVAISQPGHAHKPDQIQPRYLALKKAGINGIVYLADNDAEGLRRAGFSEQAAAAIGLPFLVISASEVWPEIAGLGSIDDAPGTPAERVEAICKAIPDAIAQQQGEEEEGGGKVELLAGAALLRFINDNYRIEWNALKQRSVVNGVLPRGEDKKLFYLDISNRFPSVRVKKEEAQDSLDYLAKQNPFNPIERYIDELKEKADRGEIQLLKLADIAGKGFGFDDWLSQLLLAHKLVQHLKRGLQPGYKADEMGIIQGRQGGYKTEAIKALSPDPSWCVTASEVKDTDEWKFLLKISQSWFYLLDECDKFLRGRDSSTLKSIITNSQDSYAKKGLNDVDDHPRPSTFWGTTNETELFNDHTGVRRWWLMQQAEGLRANPGWIQRNRDSIWATVYTWAMWGVEGHLPDGSEVQKAAEARAWAATYSLDGADRYVAILSAIPVQGDGLPLPISQQNLILQATEIDIERLRMTDRKRAQDLIGDVTRTITADNFHTHDGHIRWVKDKRRVPGHANPVKGFVPGRVAAKAAQGKQQAANFQADPIPRVPSRSDSVPAGWNGQTLWQETVLSTLFQRSNIKEVLKKGGFPDGAVGPWLARPPQKDGTLEHPQQIPSAAMDLPVPSLGPFDGPPSEQTAFSAPPAGLVLAPAPPPEPGQLVEIAALDSASASNLRTEQLGRTEGLPPETSQINPSGPISATKTITNDLTPWQQLAMQWAARGDHPATIRLHAEMPLNVSARRIAEFLADPGIADLVKQLKQLPPQSEAA